MREEGDSAGDVVYEALDFDIWYNNILVLLGIPSGWLYPFLSLSAEDGNALLNT